MGETDAASLHAESALAACDTAHRRLSTTSTHRQQPPMQPSAPAPGRRVPGAGKTWHDYQLLGAAEDAVARHQGKRQRR